MQLFAFNVLIRVQRMQAEQLILTKSGYLRRTSGRNRGNRGRNPETSEKKIMRPFLPKPSGCPPIRTILQSSPEELVNKRSEGNLEE